MNCPECRHDIDYHLYGFPCSGHPECDCRLSQSDVWRWNDTDALHKEIERITNNLSSSETHLLEISDKLEARLRRAENVISQFVHASAPMTPEQRAVWTAWKDGE